MRLVEVEWVDSISHCDGPWRSKKELEDDARPGPCYTAGYLFAEDEHKLTVILSHGEEEVGVGITIPKAAVLKVTNLSRELPLAIAM